MYVSPTRGTSVMMSTCTLSFMPSARTITFLCGQFSASSGVTRFMRM